MLCRGTCYDPTRHRHNATKDAIAPAIASFAKIMWLICVLLTFFARSAAFSLPSTTRFGSEAWRRRVGVYAKDICADDEHQPSFFIRQIREEDLGAAANILADSFYSNKDDANFFTRRIERMNTYLSLKSRFETFRYAERSGSLQCMLVACSSSNDDKIVAFCEVDNRPPGGEINPAPRPYISNLAVDEGFRRRGSATALVTASEDIVRGWDMPRLYLRVNDDTDGAKAMYRGCGYEVVSTVVNAEGETVLLLGKAL